MESATTDELTDQQILELTQKLKEEEAGKRPLVGPKEPISALKDEYKVDNSPFINKLNWLERRHHLRQVRRLRGDGSCFYRAITFQLVFQAVATSTQGTLLAALQQAQKDITFADAEIVHDFAEPLYALLTKQPPTTPDEVVQAFNDYEISNSAVVFIRLITSSSLRKSADDYLPFLFSYENDLRVLDPETGLPSMENFCANYIEASDSEADHLAIQALSKALDLGFKVAQLDQSFSSANSESTLPSDELPVDFVEMEGTAFTLGGAILLLRPGHYDLLLP